MTISARSRGEAAIARISRVSCQSERCPCRWGGGCRTVAATATKASSASPPEAQNPARQPCHSTSSASGLALSSMPQLPKAWMMPDQSAKRCPSMARAA